MTPNSNGSTPAPPKSSKTYAIINQGTSGNTLWHDIKTLRWAVEPGEGMKLHINLHIIKLIQSV
jgi:hypothetical protein